MDRSIKTWLNSLFLIATLSGVFFIFSGIISGPALLIALYGYFAGRGISGCYNVRLAEKRIDRVYFMGLLFTAFSLCALFYKLKVLGPVLPEGKLVALALSCLAMAVSSGFAAIAVRFILWNQYRADHRKSKESRGESRPIRVILAGE